MSKPIVKTNAKVFDELTDADLERIREETLARDAIEPRAKAVRYDRKADRLVLELKNGVVLLIPTCLLQGVAGADPKKIADVQTDTRGYGVHFEQLDEDFSVPGLLAGVFGTKRWMDELRASGQLAPSTPSAAEIGRKGGSARSEAKSAASRANGKLGGRPRKEVAA